MIDNWKKLESCLYQNMIYLSYLYDNYAKKLSGG